MGRDLEKKRKRDKEDQGHKKRKKHRDNPPQEPTQPSSVIRVSEVLQLSSAPVIATSPGLQVPDTTSFQPFSKSVQRSRDGKKEKYEELLLHSTDHPQVDYTAREINSKHQRHYVAIYDTQAGELKVIETKRMEVRSSVRSQEASAEDMRPPETKLNAQETRNELMMAFGNRKARKMVEAKTLNAITPAGNRNTNLKKLDAASKALLDSAKDAVSSMATVEDLAKAAQAARPVPPHNPNARLIEDVYRPQSMIGTDVLAAIPVKDWTDAFKKGDELFVPSKFVANRIKRVLGSGNLMMIRILRYVSFLLIFLNSAGASRRGLGKQVLWGDVLYEALSPATEPVVNSIRRKFSKDGKMSQHHVDLLITHCCAMACVLDGYKVNITDLESDFKLNRDQMTTYFREIGATVKEAVDISKRKRPFAILALPLQFPQTLRRYKQRTG